MISFPNPNFRTVSRAGSINLPPKPSPSKIPISSQVSGLSKARLSIDRLAAGTISSQMKKKLGSERNSFQKPMTPVTMNIQKNDMPAPGPIIPKRRNATRGKTLGKRDEPINTIGSFKKPGQAIKMLKIAPVIQQPIQHMTHIEMFQKSNNSLVDMMKIKKDHTKQINQQKIRQIANGQDVSAMLTPMHTESQRTLQMSQISTPRLTPLRARHGGQGGKIISRFEISDLEGQIRSMESQIGKVVFQGQENRLDKLEKRLNATASIRSHVSEGDLLTEPVNPQELNQDIHQLFDLNKFDQELQDIENSVPQFGSKDEKNTMETDASRENKYKIEFKKQQQIVDKNDISKMSLKQSIKGLFQFVEIESNISLEKLENSKFKSLKYRINELLFEQDAFFNHEKLMLKKKLPMKKRQFKTKLKTIRKYQNQEDEEVAYSSQGELCHMMIPPDSPDSETAGAVNSVTFRGMGIPPIFAKSKRALNKIVTRSQIKSVKRKMKGKMRYSIGI